MMELEQVDKLERIRQRMIDEIHEVLGQEGYGNVEIFLFNIPNTLQLALASRRPTCLVGNGRRHAAQITGDLSGGIHIYSPYIEEPCQQS